MNLSFLVFTKFKISKIYFLLKKASINGSARVAQTSRLEDIVVKLKKEANLAIPTEHLCIHFNGVSGVEKCGRDYVEAQILFKGMCTPKRKPSDQEQVTKKFFPLKNFFSLKNLFHLKKIGYF